MLSRSSHLDSVTDENIVPGYFGIQHKELSNDHARVHKTSSRTVLGDVTGSVNSILNNGKSYNGSNRASIVSGSRNSMDENVREVLDSENEQFSIYASNTLDTTNSNDVSGLLEDHELENIQRVPEHMSNNDSYHTEETSVNITDENICEENDILDYNEFTKPPYNVEIEEELKKAEAAYSRSYLDPMDDDNYDSVMVVELAPGIFQYLRYLEVKYCPNPHYMNMQTELKPSYRSTLLDWIVQVDDRFQLLPETLYLTVNLIDRFLSKSTIKLNKFQLVGAVAMFIAAKYEEINCPTIKDFIYMLDNAYTKEELSEAERYVLNSLEFEIGWPGPMSFLRRISKADDYDYNIRTLAKYLLETTIMDPRLIGTAPSWLAAGAYFLSKTILGYNSREHNDAEDSIVAGWTRKHVFYSGYTQQQVFPISSLILENCRHAQERHAAIWTKYSDRRHHRSSILVDKWIDLAETKMKDEY